LQGKISAISCKTGEYCIACILRYLSMSEPDKNFTFRMPNELREAITTVGEIEDRSLSKIAEYLMWSGFETYCEEKRLLSPFEIKQLSQGYKRKLQELGLVPGEDSDPENQSVPVRKLDDEKAAKKKKAQ
jgi:hypothetical protein